MKGDGISNETRFHDTRSYGGRPISPPSPLGLARARRNTDTENVEFIADSNEKLENEGSRQDLPPNLPWETTMPTECLR